MGSCSVELSNSFIDLPCSARHILVWCNQHQILIAALLALLSAYFTISNIRKQIAQNRKIHEDQLEFDRKAKLTSLLYKAFLTSDALGRSYRHVLEVKQSNPDVEDGNLASVFQATIRDDTMPERVNAPEFEAFVKSGGTSIIQMLLEQERALSMERVFIKKYENYRRELHNRLIGITEYQEVDGRLIGTTELKKSDNQHELWLKYEMQNVLNMYCRFLEKNYAETQALMLELSNIAAENDIKVKFEFPDDPLIGF